MPLLAWVLLLGNLFWVLAYDTEYAMVDRDDDLRIGMKTSAITLGRADVPVIMVVLRGLSWRSGPRRWPAASRRWRSLVAWPRQRRRPVALRLIRDREREGCFKAFRLNHWLGFTVFAGVVAGYALGRRAPLIAPNSSPSSRARCAGRLQRLHEQRLHLVAAPWTVIAASVVPPLEVTRWRSTSGGSLGGARQLGCAGEGPDRQPVGLLARQSHPHAGMRSWLPGRRTHRPARSRTRR